MAERQREATGAGSGDRPATGEESGEVMWLDDNAVWKGEVEGLPAFIVPHPGLGKGWGIDCGLNGYIMFPQRPVRESGYGGILTYVPVHGGITYAEAEGEGMVYGFDTGHADSGKFPIRDEEWIRGQIAVMARGIRKAAEVEADYLLCFTSEEKAKWVQMVLDIQSEQSWNLGVAITMLSGEL